MKARWTIALLLVLGAALVLILDLRDRNPPTSAAPRGPLVTAEAGPEPLPLEESSTEPSARQVVPSEPPANEEKSIAVAPSPPTAVAPDTERSASIRIHVRTPDGRPFAQVLREARPPATYWFPTVLVTVQALDDELAASLPWDAGQPLGMFTPRTSPNLKQESCIGEVELHADPPVFLNLMLYRKVLASEQLVVLRKNAEFVLDPDAFLRDQSGVSMRILDRVSAQPIEKANVNLESRIAGTTHSSGTTSRRDGSVAFTPWAAGAWTLRVEKQGYRKLSREIVLPPGEIVDLGDLELETGIPLRVRVLATDPEEELGVQCTPLAEMQGAVPRASMSFAPYRNPQGEYEFLLEEGTSVLKAMRFEPPFKMSPYVIVQDDQAGTLIDLELFELVSVKLFTSRVGPGQTVELRDDHDIRLEQAHEVVTSPIQFHLVPGRYHVLLGRPDGTHEERTIEVGPTDLEITLD
jgi:hypothetical protein